MDTAEALVPEVMEDDENKHRRNRRPPGETQAAIVRLVNEGHSQSEIGAALGITQQAVGQAVKRARKNGKLPPAVVSASKNLPAVQQPADLYDVLARVEREGLEKARRLILGHIDEVVPEMFRLLKEATPDDKERVKMADVWARIIFPAIKRTEHTGTGGSPLSILFKGINRGPQTVEE